MDCNEVVVFHSMHSWIFYNVRMPVRSARKRRVRHVNYVIAEVLCKLSN